MDRLSLPVAVVLAVVGTGCRSHSTPTAPSGPPATSRPSPSTPVSSGPGQGTITIREFSPSPGATLTVRACPSGAVTRPCADQWRSTIDVHVNREMTNAVLVVRFYDGVTLCGLSANTLDVLPPDRAVTFDLSSIWLSGFGLTPCQLATRTTRMEIELWSDSSSWTNTLMMELPGTYTFVSQ
jgi:hypothetical protein